jgi:hypothetical protein
MTPRDRGPANPETWAQVAVGDRGAAFNPWWPFHKNQIANKHKTIA